MTDPQRPTPPQPEQNPEKPTANVPQPEPLKIPDQPRPTDSVGSGPIALQCQFRHESPPPVHRAEWIVVCLLLTGSVSGLMLTGYGLLKHETVEPAKQHSGDAAKQGDEQLQAEAENDSDKRSDANETNLISAALAFLFALACGTFGFSLLWLRRLGSPNWKALRWFSDRFPHLPHEVGMAFIVGAVVFVCVEFTLRVAEERSNKKSFATYNKELKSDVKSQLDTQLAAFRQTLKAKNDIIEQAQKARADAEAASKALSLTKSETVSFLTGLALASSVPKEPIPSDERMAQIVKDLADATKAYDALQSMASDKEFDFPTLRMWESLFLDGYGMTQRLAGDFNGAEKSFREALRVDKDRFQQNQKDENRASNLLLAYDRIVGIAFCQMEAANAKRAQAIADQKAGVKWLDDLAKNAAGARPLEASGAAKKQADMLSEWHRKRLARFEELEKTTYLPNLSVQWQGNRLTLEDTLTDGDLPFFGRDPKFEVNGYKSRCKVYALRLPGGKTYKIRATPKGDNPIDVLVLLQTGLFTQVREVDEFGASKAEEFKVTIKHTETYRLFVASSPRPAPENAPATGGFNLTIEAVEKDGG